LGGQTGPEPARLAGAFRRRSQPSAGAGQAPIRQAPSDLNRDACGCPANLRNRTHAIAPAMPGQMAVAPARAIKSPRISAVTTTTNAIMGASRTRPATTVTDAQFRTLLIAPLSIPSPFTLPARM
jgi:hypothetical protein